MLRHDRRSCFLAPRLDRGGSALEEGMDVEDDLEPGWLVMFYFVRGGGFQITVSELALQAFILDCYCCCPMQSLLGLSYLFPSNPSTDPLYTTDTSTAQVPPTSLPTDIQGIQTLMGAMFVSLFFSSTFRSDFYVHSADFHALVEPYPHHFYLTSITSRVRRWTRELISLGYGTVARVPLEMISNSDKKIIYCIVYRIIVEPYNQSPPESHFFGQ